MREVKFNKFFPLEKERLFRYFVDKNLVEQWSAPNGLTLRLPKFEARTGGNYRYEHTSKDGVFVCEGNFKEIIPNERIVQLDKFGKDPSGNTIFKNLETTIDFESKGGGTEIRMRQTGFDNEQMVQMCQEGWEQCLDTLSRLVNKESGMQQGRSVSGSDRELRT